MISELNKSRIVLRCFYGKIHDIGIHELSFRGKVLRITRKYGYKNKSFSHMEFLLNPEFKIYVHSSWLNQQSHVCFE